MNIYEIATQAVASHSYALIRRLEGDQYEVNKSEVELCDEDDEEALRFLNEPTAKPKDFVLLDVQTANAIKLVYEAITKPESKAKYLNLSLSRLIDFTWSCVK